MEQHKHVMKDFFTKDSGKMGRLMELVKASGSAKIRS